MSLPGPLGILTDAAVVVELSPFVIAAESETGWVATQTLGGSRMKTGSREYTILRDWVAQASIAY